jgi:hypothetical protein
MCRTWPPLTVSLLMFRQSATIMFEQPSAIGFKTASSRSARD